MAAVLEYKCPCCGAGLTFNENTQKLACAYCDNEFTLETIQAFQENAGKKDAAEFTWDEETPAQWSDAEQARLRAFTCPSCGGEILAEANTAATLCPYCENPTILASRLSGNIRPDSVLPFQTGKEDAKAAFLSFCKGKPLLPKAFTQAQRLEKITGVYVPFWLYDCSGSLEGRYHATRVHFWSDAKYNYTRTEHFLLFRTAVADFSGIPMDGSSKMDDAMMESIEPFDYSKIVDFNMAFLSGFLADKYDVEAKRGQERVQQRAGETMNDMLQSTFAGYATVLPESRQLNIRHGKVKYVLLPVWVLNTRYKDKIYTFLMNGQSGKISGSFPICPKRTAAWFMGIFAAVSAVAGLLQFLFF